VSLGRGKRRQASIRKKNLGVWPKNRPKGAGTSSKPEEKGKTSARRQKREKIVRGRKKVEERRAKEKRGCRAGYTEVEEEGVRKETREGGKGGIFAFRIMLREGKKSKRLGEREKGGKGCRTGSGKDPRPRVRFTSIKKGFMCRLGKKKTLPIRNLSHNTKKRKDLHGQCWREGEKSEKRSRAAREKVLRHKGEARSKDDREKRLGDGRKRLLDQERAAGGGGGGGGGTTSGPKKSLYWKATWPRSRERSFEKNHAETLRKGASRRGEKRASVRRATIRRRRRGSQPSGKPKTEKGLIDRHRHGGEFSCSCRGKGRGKKGKRSGKGGGRGLPNSLV